MNKQELQQQARWITYKARPKDPKKPDGKLAKEPYDTVKRQHINPHAAENWHTYEDAKALANRYNVKMGVHEGKAYGAGCGVSLVGAGITCIDIDDCMTPPTEPGGAYTIDPYALAILEQCPATYIEVSLRRTGLHIFGTLAAPHENTYTVNGHTIEVYSKAQFIAWTDNSDYTALGIRHLESDELSSLDGVIDWLESQAPKRQDKAPDTVPSGAAIPPHSTPNSDTLATVWGTGYEGRKTAPMSIEERREKWYRACFDTKLKQSIHMMESTSTQRHRQRLKAGRLLGGAMQAMANLGYSVMSIDSAVDALYTAQPPADNKRTEAQAIEDGIRHGHKTPITLEPFPEDTEDTAANSPAMVSSEGAPPLHSTPPSKAPDTAPDPDTIAALFERMARSREQIAQAIEDGTERRLLELITSPNGLPLLTAGASLLAARPKMRKSWLALHIANCIVTGEPLFNDERFRVAKRGKAVYLDLEMATDTALTRQDAMNTDNALDYVTRTMWQELVDEFIDKTPNDVARLYLDWQYNKYKDTDTPLCLAIIDTVNPLLPTSYPKGTDIVTAEYLWYKAWARWGEEHNVAVIFVSHLNKAVGMYDNPADAVPGGAKLAGAVDIFTITKDTRGGKKEDTDADADAVIFKGQLRNGSIDPALLKFDTDAYHHMTDNSTQRQRIDWSVIRQDIGRAVDEGYTRQAQITKYLEGKHASGTVRKTLRAMRNAGHLVELERGRYGLPQGWPYHKGNK